MISVNDTTPINLPVLYSFSNRLGWITVVFVACVAGLMTVWPSSTVLNNGEWLFKAFGVAPGAGEGEVVVGVGFGEMVPVFTLEEVELLDVAVGAS